jgi:hypothetical protein
VPSIKPYITQCRCPGRFFLKREAYHLGSFLTSARKKVANADAEVSPAPALSGAKANGRFEMFNPEIVLPSPQSQPTAPYPTASKARVQLQERSIKVMATAISSPN